MPNDSPNLVRRALLIIGALSAFKVSAQPQPLLAPGERILKDATGVSVRPYSTQDFGRARYEPGRSVLVPEKQAEYLLMEVRKRIPKGLIAFIGVTHDLSPQKSRGFVELVVAEGKDQFDILRAAATDGINFGLNTEAIIKELQSWDQEFGIDIWQAETDTVQLRLKTLPKDLMNFAKRVYKFCPDIADQGAGSVDELARLIGRERAVFLWWD
jgi:hypothetical protein